MSAEAQIVTRAVSQMELADPLRDRVNALLPAFEAFRRLCRGVVEPDIQANAARTRLLSYLKMHPQQLIDGKELALVSGISEWARRVRELRKQEGWRIYTGVTFAELAASEPENTSYLKQELGFDPTSAKPSQYVLVSEEQDLQAKHRWQVANALRKRVRNGVLSAKEAILEYLKTNTGTSVDGEELRYVANDQKEWARRARELRTEEGYAILTKQQGRVDLPIGSYVLEGDRRFEPHDRKISDATRVKALERDHFSCRICGWRRGSTTVDDPRKNLELHHIEHHARGGSNELDNLITLCNVHHDDVHAGRLTFDRIEPPAPG